MALVQSQQSRIQVADSAGFATNYLTRLLTSITNAINGTSGIVATGVSQITLGNAVSMSSGLGSPDGVVPGNLGDQYVNLSGGAGATLWVKESGAAGSKNGWAAK